ncbi:MAG: hypothetical protein IJZ25_03940 [Lachnospiraceae bacterium]|nr:hypothetical protein [Lachnospiraceae bacterium]
MKTTKNLTDVMFKSILVFAFVAMMWLLIGTKADADALDYLGNNYTGTVSAEDGAGLYTQPGSINPTVNDADGNAVRVPYGTEVLIVNEGIDHETDMWYQCYVTVDGVEYEGYLYNGRVTRGEAIPHTPTPAPTNTPEPTAPAPTEDGSPTDKFEDTQNDNSVNKDTNKMVKDADGFKPWKWIIILIIVILIFMVVYTFWVRESERKLEREIERYSNRPQYEPLEGELEEDFAEAKSLYYDHIGLGDQSNKSLGEVIGNPDDVQLDMSGIFDDEVVEDDSVYGEKISTPEEEEDSLKSLIASLEEKLGTSSFDEEDVEDVPVDDVQEITETAQVPEYVNDNRVPEFARRATTENSVRIPAPVRETKVERNYVDPGLASIFEEEEDDYEETFDLRDMLDNLNEGDILIHTVYGEGVVEDNSDSQIIQVRFGNDVRFLKKEKLVKKNLIEF